MHYVKTLNALLLTTLVASCGSSKKGGENDQNAQPTLQAPTPVPTLTVSDAEKAKRDGIYPTLPRAAIMRVPVDANGQENGASELRSYNGSADLTSAASLGAAFQEGTAPDRVVSTAPTSAELDSSTSTQAWASWLPVDSSTANHRGGNGPYGRGGYPGNGAYPSPYGNGGYGNTGGGYPGNGAYPPPYGNGGYGNGGYGNGGYGNGGYGNGGYGNGGYGNGGYGNGGYGNGGYGNGGYGNGGNNTACGNSYWSSVFRPILYWFGLSWNYGYANCYQRYNNYNYYYYQPVRNW